MRSWSRTFYPLAHGNVIAEGRDIRVITVQELGRARSAPFVLLPPGVGVEGAGIVENKTGENRALVKIYIYYRYFSLFVVGLLMVCYNRNENYLVKVYLFWCSSHWASSFTHLPGLLALPKVFEALPRKIYKVQIKWKRANCFWFCFVFFSFSEKITQYVYKDPNISLIFWIWQYT